MLTRNQDAFDVLTRSCHLMRTPLRTSEFPIWLLFSCPKLTSLHVALSRKNVSGNGLLLAAKQMHVRIFAPGCFSVCS